MRYFSLKAIYLKSLSVRLADNFEQINPAFVVTESLLKNKFCRFCSYQKH